MNCDLCNEEGVHTHLITRISGKGENLLVIENVPVMTCSHCGENYLTADTLHEIERIKRHRQSYHTSSGGCRFCSPSGTTHEHS